MKSYYLKNFNGFVILVWISLGVIMWMQYANGASVAEAGLLALSIILTAYPFTTYLSRNLLQKAMREKKMLLFIGQYFFVSCLMSLFLCPIFRVFMYLEGIGVFPRSDVFAGNATFMYDFVVGLLTTVFLNFGFCGLRFYEENLRLQRVLAESQLQILQAQINPHFMFNVLNHIYVLMQKDVELASSLLLKYSDILRYQLYNGSKERVVIRQEVQFLQDYIDVEMVRWKGKLTVDCFWDVGQHETELPPLLLITFIENAFKHVSRSVSEKGYILINLMQEGRRLRLDVENSVSAIKRERKKDPGIGLANIRRRLDILFPGKYTLSVTETGAAYHTSLIITL